MFIQNPPPILSFKHHFVAPFCIVFFLLEAYRFFLCFRKLIFGFIRPVFRSWLKYFPQLCSSFFLNNSGTHTQR